MAIVVLVQSCIKWRFCHGHLVSVSYEMLQSYVPIDALYATHTYIHT